LAVSERLGAVEEGTAQMEASLASIYIECFEILN
jgi:hypothetical protein